MPGELGESQTDTVPDYVDVNPTASNSIVLVHGWPSLWSTWSNQIQALQVRIKCPWKPSPLTLWQNDYHLIVPDLPGFGSSMHPGDGRGSMRDLVGDVVCILEHASVKSAVCIGSDTPFVLRFQLTTDSTCVTQS